MCRAGLFFLCALCVAGCAAHDRAVIFDNVPANDGAAEGLGSGGEELSGMPSDGVEICVYVCGEVKEPGVYFLAAGSRADDALCAAGGFTEEADKSYVNLAAKVNDGDRLYFPGIAETEQERAAEKALKAGLVDINTADEALLCTLPGIGTSRAQAIIAYREEHGSFKSKEDIMKVSGIKDSAYRNICDKITVGNE